MCNCISHTAIKKTQTRAIEGNGHCDAIGAVSIEKQRRVPVTLETLLVNDGEGNLRAVASCCPETFRCVTRWIVSSQYFLTFEKRRLAGQRVVVVDTLGRYEALIAIAVSRRFVVRPVTWKQRIHRFGHGN